MLDETPFAYARQIGLKPLTDLREWNAPIACSGVSATRSWLAQGNNRDKAKRFLMALVESIALMKKDQVVVNRAIDAGSIISKMTRDFGARAPDFFLAPKRCHRPCPAHLLASALP